MHFLDGEFAKWVNRKRKRSGHLFQGRFHSFLIEKEAYLMEVMRYVALNPVRAKLVARHFETALTLRRWSNDPARLAFAALARKEAVATFAAIADRLGMTSPGARSLVARAFRLEASDREFRQHLDALRLRITELITRV